MIHAQLTMRSNALEMDTKVDVLLPEDRHTTKDTRGKKYPVLYILHGAKEDNSSWMNLSNIFLMCRDLDLIVVMPTTYRGSYVDAVYGQNYYTYISEELPVKMKNIFPISDDPKDTFIMGESMGGYGTMRIALSKPENYAKAVVLSGGNFDPFHSFMTSKLTTGVFGDSETWKNSDNNLVNLVQKLKTSTILPEMQFYCGTEDRAYDSCKEFYEYIKNELPLMKISAKWDSGKHNFFYWNKVIPEALHFFGFEIPQNSVI